MQQQDKKLKSLTSPIRFSSWLGLAIFQTRFHRNADRISNPWATHHPFGSKVCAKLTHFEIWSAESIFAQAWRQSKNSPWSYFANSGFHYFSYQWKRAFFSLISIPIPNYCHRYNHHSSQNLKQRIPWSGFCNPSLILVCFKWWCWVEPNPNSFS